MANATIVANNATQTARLEALLARLSDAQLETDLGEGWTVAVALAHLAFWDRRAALVLDKMAREGRPFYDLDDDIVNESLVAEWAALAPRVAAELALSAAHAVDAAAASAPEGVWGTLGGTEHEYLLHRANHRREHVDQIDAAVGS